MICYTECSHCRLCGGKDLQQVFDLGFQSIGSVFPKLTSDQDPPLAPLSIVMCKKCELVQLQHTVQSNELYTDSYGYRSGLNNTMINHLKGIANYAMEFVSIIPDTVILDIGCNDGTLLGHYPKCGGKVGIDPCGKQFQEHHSADIHLEADFFSKGVYPVSEFAKPSIVTSISMFYDLPDPTGFAKDVADILDDNGVWIMEQSYVYTMLERNSFDTICHEHLEYYGLKQIDYICKEAGLKIIDVSFNDINGGSFRVAIAKQQSVFIPTEAVHQVLTFEANLNVLELFMQFTKRIEIEKEKLMSFIEGSKKEGKTLAIYGASTKGNTLLQYYGINVDLINYGIAERNPRKYGCRTPCTRIPISSEEHVRALKPDYMLVLPWHFKTEFLSREENYLRNGGKLVFPLPYFEICEFIQA